MEPIAIQHNDTNNLYALFAVRVLTITCIFRFMFELFRYSVLRKIVNGVPISSAQFVRNERIELFSWCFQLIILATTLILLIIWLHRAYGNLLQFEETKNLFPQKMAIIGWFIPIANYWIPYRILSKTVKGHEIILMKQQFLRINPQRQMTAASFWIAWVVASITHAFSFYYPLEESLNGVILMIISLVSYSLAGFWGIRMITDMRMMEKGLSEMKHVNTFRDDQDDLLDSI